MMTPALIAKALGRPTPADGSPELGQWETWIDNARQLIRSGDGNHRGLGSLELLDQETVDYVVREAVIEKIRRPEPVTQVDIQIDDGRVSKRYETGRGTVYITDDWWAMLSPTGRQSAAFSVRPGFQPDRAC